MKKCPSCGGVTNNFHRNSRNKDRLASECKYCSKLYQAAAPNRGTPEYNDRERLRRQAAREARRTWSIKQN